MPRLPAQEGYPPGSEARRQRLQPGALSLIQKGQGLQEGIESLLNGQASHEEYMRFLLGVRSWLPSEAFKLEPVGYV